MPKKSTPHTTTTTTTTIRASSQPTALITGASSGIGEALAGCFAAAKHDVILVARSEGKLKILADQLSSKYGVAVSVQPSDLSTPGAAEHLLAALTRKHSSVDVLVNCAGVLEQGAFTAIDHAKHQAIIDLNISGLTAMLSAFIPGMVERGRGRVLNVASIAAFQPIPMLASYAASKAYVLSLSESLAEELRDTGVTVTALCPGITATNMLTQAAGANDKLSQLPAFLIADVQNVADLAFAATMQGDAICVPGVFNQAAMIASRGAPKWLVRRIGGLLGRRSL